MNCHHNSKTSGWSALPFLHFLNSMSLSFSSHFSLFFIHIHHPTLLLSVPALCTCPQGSARSGWKLFRRPRAPPLALPRSAPTASPTTPLQTSEACWSSAVTKAECWCPWRGVKSGSAKQNRYCQHRRDFLSIGWQLPVWKRKDNILLFEADEAATEMLMKCVEMAMNV